MRETEAQERLVSLEYLRGVAAFMVAFGHLSWPLVDKGGLTHLFGPGFAGEVFSARNAMPMFHQYTPQSLLWVNCFFLISGFVVDMSLAKNSASSFLIQRAFRIYPMFWVGLAAQIAVVLLIAGKLPSLRDFLDEALLICAFSILHVSWTLLAEAHFYVIAALFLMLKLSITMRTLIINAMFVFAFAAHLIRAPWADTATMSLFMSTVFWLAWIHTGSLAYGIWMQWKSGQSITPLFRMALAHLSIFTIGCAVLGRAHNQHVYNHAQATAFLGALLIFCLILIGERSMPRLRVLSWLGRISYPLYVLHMPVGWLTFYVAYRYFGIVPGFVAALTTSIAAATAAHFAIEAPTNRLGKRLSERWRRGVSRGAQAGVPA